MDIIRITNQKIYDDIYNLYGFEIYDSELEDHILEYLKHYYPGPHWIIYSSEESRPCIDVLVTDEKEHLLHVLKYDLF